MSPFIDVVDIAAQGFKKQGMDRPGRTCIASNFVNLDRRVPDAMKAEVETPKVFYHFIMLSCSCRNAIRAISL